MSIASNLERLRNEIANACARAHRDPNAVALMAVSKMNSAEAIREAYKGNAYFSPSIAKRLLDRYRDSFLNGGKPINQKAAVHLTSRELEVLQLVAEGKGNKQMAAELCISIKTVEKHRQQVMDKLDLHEVAGLTRYAIAQGIIESAPKLV